MFRELCSFLWGGVSENLSYELLVITTKQAFSSFPWLHGTEGQTPIYQAAKDYCSASLTPYKNEEKKTYFIWCVFYVFYELTWQGDRNPTQICLSEVGSLAQRKSRGNNKKHAQCQALSYGLHVRPPIYSSQQPQ